MARRHRRQAETNQQLKAHIDELRAQYRQLADEYNQTITRQQAQQQPQALDEADRVFLDRAINTINNMMLNGQVDAEGVAHEMGMSLYQFRQRLTKITGEKPQDYITILRMKRAKHLLDSHPNLSIAEIAALCAYNDTPNFTRAFKKFYGQTPTQYIGK